MIKLLKEGIYRLFGSNAEKFLVLDHDGLYAWKNSSGVGELLSTKGPAPEEKIILCSGKYRLYDVKEESNLSASLHLELSPKEGFWQGYLLLTGLPTLKEVRKKIVPTIEKVTHYFSV